MERLLHGSEMGGGNWGTLYRSSFWKVCDGSPKSITLLPEEQLICDELIKDGGQTVS